MFYKMETCYEYTDDGKLWISTDEKKTINRVLKFKEQFPDDVTILQYPKDNDGCLYCWAVKKKFSLNLNRKAELSEEERARRSEKMKAVLRRSDKI